MMGREHVWWKFLNFYDLLDFEINELYIEIIYSLYYKKIYCIIENFDFVKISCI